MKKIALVSAIALGSLFYNNANAQILQIGLHLGGHRPVVEASLATPVAVNYTDADDYYYLPDVDAYYSVPERVYYYNNGYNWVPAANLPGDYCNYDWRAARHYEVRAARPFLRADFYRERYSGRVYDWRRFNATRYDARRDDRFDRRPDNRFDNRRDERFDNRRDDRFDNRRDDRFDNRRDDRYNNNRGQDNNQPVFRGGNAPRGIEHSPEGWNRGNKGGNDNRNDNRGQQNDDRPQRQNGNGNWQQRSGDQFASNDNHGHHGFGN